MSLLKKETAQQTSYNFTANETNTWFGFTTVNGIDYEVTFINSPGLFYNYPEFASFIYEMSILLAADSAPFDYGVQLTIAAIVRRFFENQKNVLLFVCDSTDGRHRQRKLKFERWYEESAHKEELEKYDGYFSDSGIEVYSAIILRKDFELKNLVLDAFFEINDPEDGGQ